MDLILSAAFCFSQADVKKLALQKVVFSLSHCLVLSKLVLLKLAVAQLVCAKLWVATPADGSHMSNLVMKMAVPILVEAEKT